MSNSLDSFLTRIGDVTIERVTPRSNSGRSVDQDDGRSNSTMKSGENNSTIHSINDRDSEETGDGETSDGEQERKMEAMAAEDVEEIHSEGSGDDMDLDETIDTEIGVRMDSERPHSESSCPDDDVEAVNILDTLPLEGAPIEGQEVTEADLLGKPLTKEDDGESIDNDKSETQSGDEDEDIGKRRTDNDDLDPAKKKQKKDDGTQDSECELKSEKKLANMRRNIREVMDETQLDEATLAAQRQEMERLRRVQEQQKIIREVQRQIAINRQNSKNQTRAISLLQGKHNNIGTSLSETPTSSSSSSQVKLPSTVMLKVNNSTAGQPQASVGQVPFGPTPRRPMESTRWQRGRGNYQGSQTSISRVAHRSSSLSSSSSSSSSSTATTATPGQQNVLQQRIRMMTPSVSISPVVPKKEPADRSEYFSDSEQSEPELDDIVYDKDLLAVRKGTDISKQPRTPKGKDVVTISSSSESSDDDCIVLSDPSGGEETDNDDDPSNSGMHTNDRYNVPDEHGRVLVNVGHPDTEPDVYLAPQVARIIKPHQIGGIRFLFDNIIESIERYKSSAGFGCILAHSMGLGKTLQVASFCDIFFRCTPAKSVLCIMPINTLQNWLSEFNMWLPYEDPNAVKPETKSVCVDVKHEIKEENSNLTDISSGLSSRPISTESAHRSLHDSTSHLSNIMSVNAYNQGYDNHNSMSNYYQDNVLNKPPVNHNVPMHPNYGSIPSNSMYHQPMGQSHEDYKPMKSEMDCHDVNKISTNQLYSGVNNQNTPMYPMMNNQSPMSTYPGYQNSSINQPPYTNNPSMVQVKQEINSEPMHIKEEPKEPAIKEENITNKEESTNEEKKVPTVTTPYCVDSPIGLEVRPRHFRLHILNDSHKTMAARARVIQEWQKVGGVLLIGYELYRQLSLKKPNKAKRKRGQPFKDTVDVEEEDKNKSLLDEMHGALVNPGPDLVICDEGHRIKNSHASISMALKQMRTKRRIVLTGYPLQNNLLEYWCMVDFVRPNYLGTKSEFCNMFERPIQNGQCIDSTPQDIRLMRYRAHVLHALLEGFVQRRSHSVLQVSLPRKEEYILLVRMTPHQRKLYDTFMNQVVKTRAVPNPLKAFAVCCKIWNHPDILYHFLRKRQANEEDDLDLEETMAEKATPGSKRSKARQPKNESKKGKKVNVTIKNKPAASIPPNSSSSSSSSTNININNDAAINDNNAPVPKNTKENYPNFTPQISNSNFNNNCNQSNAYTQDYQNYRSNDQNNYYRNDQVSGEFNNYYNNQNQRFPNQDPPFQSYQQNNVNYNPTQNYQQNQSQTFNSPNDQTNNTQQKYSNTTSSDFNANSNNTNNYDMFPKQFCYQDQGRNYPSNVNQTYPQNANQSSNFDATISNQSSNMSMTNYSSYGQPNSQQNYLSASGNPMQQIYPRNENQPIQNTSMGYPSNQQNLPQQPPGSVSTNYMNNQGILSMQQNTNQLIPSNVHPYSGPPGGRINQSNSLPIQNSQQAQPTQNQLPSNVPNQSQPLYQTSNQPNSGNSMGNPIQNPPHGYMNNTTTQTVMPQNQVRGYPSSSSSSSSSSGSIQQNQQPINQYPTPQVPYQSNLSGQPQVPSQTQTREYSTDQTSTPAKHSFPQSHLTSNAGPPNTYPVNQSCSSSTQVNQNHSYPSANQQSSISPMTNQSHRYSAVTPNSTTLTSNQSLGYSSSQHSTTPINTNESQNFPGHYQINQASQQNPSMQHSTNYPDASAANQYKTPENNYSWQGNYSQTIRQDQCNDQYFREPNTNQYDNNYFSQQNYVQNPYDFNNAAHGHASTNINPVNANKDSNLVTPATIIDQTQQPQGNFDKMSKDVSTSVGQSQPLLPQNNVNPTNFNTNDSSGPKQNINTFIGTNTSNNSSNNSSNSNNSHMNSNINSNNSNINNNNNLVNSSLPIKEEDKDKEEVAVLDKDKEEKSDEEVLTKDEEKDSKIYPTCKEDPGIPYDWATELMKGYVPGLIDASAKMTIFFCILEEAVRLGDRVLAFSQSLFTLNLIEDFLSRNNLKYPDGQTEAWVKNINYYRLDGSTTALEREKLINEFNQNPKIHLFLVSTRAGSLGINLVGANRAIVFDASWNPCHDTQAVCRVYRYGQRKPCYVYRLVTDNCLERKIYDRQISKQGMADRVVDQCNPDAHLSLKEATTLSWDWEEDSQVQDFSSSKGEYTDEIMHYVLDQYSSLLTKQPFHHESLLVDRKDKKLSQAEKRLARRGYELEKMAANCSKPSYNYVPGNTATRAGGLQIRAIRGGGDTGVAQKPVASVRPMQQRGAENLGTRGIVGSRWIPAEVWQRQGMSAQEMTLPLDVVIPTNSPDKSSIVLKAGQRVMVLKSPKGIYMQLESGKIIAIRTALKMSQQKREEEPKKAATSTTQRNTKPEVSFPLRNNSAISIIPKSTSSTPTPRIPPRPNSSTGCRQPTERDPVKRPRAVPTPVSKTNTSHISLAQQVSLQRVSKIKHDGVDQSLVGENSNSSDSQPRTDQRVEEVRLEDVVAEANSNPDYSPSNQSQAANSDTEPGLPKSFERKSQEFGTSPIASSKTMQSIPLQRGKSESDNIPKIDKNLSTSYDAKECEMPLPTPNYGNQYQSHMMENPNQINPNDEIIIEESPSTPLTTHPSSTHTPHSVNSSISTQMMHQQQQQPQQIHQENRQTRPLVPSQPYIERPSDISKNLSESSNTSSTTPTLPLKDRATELQDASTGESQRVPQAYPYSQYPRYYDYADPRSRNVSTPYGSYFPTTPTNVSHSANTRNTEAVKTQLEIEKLSEERPNIPVTPATYSQPPVQPPVAPTSITSPAAPLSETKNSEPVVAQPTIPTTQPNRTVAHIPTAFNHPTGERFTGTYPPAPYDPYSQHYPATPNSTTSYPPTGAPGYSTYGGPAYNTDYAHMYSAFHGPPPAADPYMHRGYAPTSTHPPNYYSPFTHPPPPPPPPPYPNYSFLPPYPNPNMPNESQPPAQ